MYIYIYIYIHIHVFSRHICLNIHIYFCVSSWDGDPELRVTPPQLVRRTFGAQWRLGTQLAPGSRVCIRLASFLMIACILVWCINCCYIIQFFLFLLIVVYRFR